MTSLYDGPIIDAHHHLWDLGSGRYSWLTDGPREVVFGSTAPLIRDYLLDDYLADMAGIGLVKSVHIQASFLEDDPAAETRWLQGIADERGFPHGIVAHARLEEPDAEAVLEAHCSQANMRGIRQILSWHRNPAWSFNERADLMQDAAWRRGFGLLRRFDLAFDMMIYSGQLGDALDLASAFPDTQIIVNHTGSPADRDDDAIAAWRSGMSGARRCHQRRGQDLRPQRLRPQLDHREHAALHPPHHRRFGTERCMFASDFPVAGLHGGAGAVYESFKTIVADFSEAEQRALFHDNAVRLYRLG